MKTTKINNMRFEIHPYAPEMNKAFYPNGKQVKGFTPSSKVSCARKSEQLKMAVAEYKEFLEKKRKHVESTLWKLNYKTGALRWNYTYIGKPEDTFVSIHQGLRKLGCKEISVKLS